MKKSLIVICALLAMLSLNSFMKLANVTIMHQMDPFENEGFYTNLPNTSYTVDISDRDKFINEAIEAANNHQVILYSLYKPLDTDIHKVYLYIPDKYQENISFYIPTNEEIDFSNTFIINHENDNTLLFNENFFIPTTIEIKSFDQIPVDNLDYFWSLTLCGDVESINQFKQSINQLYPTPILILNDFVGGLDDSLTFYITQFFENDGSLILLSLVFLLFISVVIINHSKKEIVILKILGKSDFYITTKLIRPIFYTSFFVIFSTLAIADLFILKRIDQLALCLFSFQLVLLTSFLIGYLVIFVLSLIYIKTIPILDSIRKKNNSITIYYLYSVVKIGMLILLVPASVENLYWSKVFLTPYLQILNNYDFYASTSTFVAFTGNGTPQQQTLINNEFNRIYEEDRYPNFYRMSIGYSQSGAPSLKMDAKTAKFLNIPCESKCTILPDLGDVNSKTFYDDVTFHLREYEVEIIEKGDLSLKYFVSEDNVGSTDTIDKIVTEMPADIQSLFKVGSLKSTFDSTMRMSMSSFTSTFFSFISMALIILIVNLSILSVYYFSHKRRLCVQYITGRKTSSMILELFIEQFWINGIAFFLIAKSVMDFSAFLFIALSLLMVEIISISCYINYMIKTGLKGELR